ncbi:hypothetical protein ACFL1E_01000 [Candidatus Omnitrophota bacterium]
MKNKTSTVVFITLVLIAKLSFAESCMPKPAEFHFLNADVVFTGKVENIEELGKQDEMYVKSKVRLNVEEVLKGDVSDSVVVFENTYYGAMFKENERYLVFAGFLDEELLTGSCSGTKNMKYLSDEFKKIERINQLIQGQMKSIKNLDEDEELKYEISIVDDGAIEYKQYDENGRLLFHDTFKDGEHIWRQFFNDGMYKYIEYLYKNGKLIYLKKYDQNGKLILEE